MSDLSLPSILSLLTAPCSVKKVHRTWEESTHSSLPRPTPFTPWCTSPLGMRLKLSTSPEQGMGKPLCTTQYSLRSRRTSGSAGKSPAWRLAGSHDVRPNNSAPKYGRPRWPTSTYKVSPTCSGRSLNTRVRLLSRKWMQAAERSAERITSEPLTRWKCKSLSSGEGRPRISLGTLNPVDEEEDCVEEEEEEVEEQQGMIWV